MENALERAAALLSKARAVVVFTGAGVSAESGIPTYRGAEDGLWSKHNFQRFANPRGYAENLVDAYAWYRSRAEGLAKAEPNAAHVAIAQLADRVERLTVVTQNIDSLHQRAGSTGVIELHGSLREFRCNACGQSVLWDQTPAAPVCAACGGMIRPGVVMFEEMLPESALETAREASARCDVLISVGTSNQVWPAAEMPLVTLRHGGSVIIVNPDLSDQPIRQGVVGVRMKAGEAMPALIPA
ncbi:MAG TPA: NAD-dependent deacylase [Gemmatimonadaceae bacterium]